MIIDTHTHVWSFPSFRDLSQHIKTTEDLIAFRTRYPELYKCSLTEGPVDNSDALIADMDKNGVALDSGAGATRLRDQRPGGAVGRSAIPTDCAAIARVGHDQEAAGYHDDPGPTREWAPGEIERCLTTLKMKGVGEIFIRSLTSEIHPEKIAKAPRRNDEGRREARRADPVSDRMVAVPRRAVLRRSRCGSTRSRCGIRRCRSS